MNAILKSHGNRKLAIQQGKDTEGTEASNIDNTQIAPISHSSSVTAVNKVTGRGITTDGLRLTLEKLTKQFNATCSINKKIRNEINVFRKERTLYDHVFKNLESLILGEEKRLICMLRRNHEFSMSLRGADDSFQSIVEMVRTTKAEDLVNVLKEEQMKYDQCMKNASEYGRKSIYNNLNTPDRVVEDGQPELTSKSSNSNQIAKRSTWRGSRLGIDTSLLNKLAGMSVPNTPHQLNEKRIAMIEKCLKDLKLITEENNLDVAVKMMAHLAEQKDDMLHSVMALELEVS